LKAPTPAAILFSLVGLVAGPAPADVVIEIDKCRQVAEGRAEIIDFEGKTARGQEVTLKGLLSKPDGPGPFRGLVILPGARGLVVPLCYASIVPGFLDRGFVTLMVAPRTARQQDGTRRYQYNFTDLASYGYAAAAALAARPDVDASRIGVWGHSNGGTAAIDVATWPAGPADTFRAVVAAAPTCPSQGKPPAIPLLVMISDKDPWTSADWCTDYAAKLVGVGTFEFQLLLGADHAYWAAPGYEAPAAKLAEERLTAFFAKYLPATR
jgi:dienelactone hydrolase